MGAGSDGPHNGGGVGVALGRGGRQPRPSRAWNQAYIISMLLAVYVLNQADRQLIPTLISGGLRCPLQNATSNGTAPSVDALSSRLHGPEPWLAAGNNSDCLPFTDVEEGLLKGPAFTVVYGVFAVSFSYFADKYNRVLILAAAVTFWSFVTCLTYFVQHFYQLALLRMLLGVSEAVCNPVAYSLIADVFSRRRRGLMMSVYHLGVYLGAGVGYIAAAANASVGWRLTFVAFGAPGIFLAALAALTIQEPLRGLNEKKDDDEESRPRVAPATAVHLVGEKGRITNGEASSVNQRVGDGTSDAAEANWGHSDRSPLLLKRERSSCASNTPQKAYNIISVFRHTRGSPPLYFLLLASSLRQVSGFTLGAYMPTFFKQAFHLNKHEYSVTMSIAGVIVIVCGSASQLLGGYLGDLMMKKSLGAKALVVLVSQLLAAPAIAGVLLSPTVDTALGLLCLAYLTAETWLGPGAAIVQDVTAPEMRAQTSALYMTVNTLIGGCGPLIAGVFIQNDTHFKGTSAVQTALLVLVPMFYVLSAAGFAAVGLALGRHNRGPPRNPSP